MSSKSRGEHHQKSKTNTHIFIHTHMQPSHTNTLNPETNTTSPASYISASQNLSQDKKKLYLTTLPFLRHGSLIHDHPNVTKCHLPNTSASRLLSRRKSNYILPINFSFVTNPCPTNIPTPQTSTPLTKSAASRRRVSGRDVVGVVKTDFVIFLSL